MESLLNVSEQWNITRTPGCCQSDWYLTATVLHDALISILFPETHTPFCVSARKYEIVWKTGQTRTVKLFPWARRMNVAASDSLHPAKAVNSIWELPPDAQMLLAQTLPNQICLPFPVWQQEDPQEPPSLIGGIFTGEEALPCMSAPYDTVFLGCSEVCVIILHVQLHQTQLEEEIELEQLTCCNLSTYAYVVKIINMWL